MDFSSPLLKSALKSSKSSSFSTDLNPSISSSFKFPSISSRPFCLLSTPTSSSSSIPNQVAVLPPFAKRFFSTPSTSTPPTTNPTASPTKPSTSASSQSPRGFAAFKARPFLHTIVFGVTHVSICWALVPLVYLGLSTTGTSNALLGGPQVAYILSRPIPTWLPIQSLTTNIQEEGTSKKKTKEPKTIEDLLDLTLRSSIKMGWTSGGAILSSIRSTSKSLSENKDLKCLTNVLTDKGSNKNGDEDRLVSATMKELKGESGSNELKSKPYYSKVWDSTLDTIGGQARKSASEVHLGNVRDAIGAWVLVKVLFPARLPLSLFLTPKVTRFLTKGFSKST